jgi:DNA-binding NtrC family response regulator
VKLLKYPSVLSDKTQSELENRVQQLVLLAKGLANEIETLQVQISHDRPPFAPKPVDFDNDGVDFYKEIERYEIELIKGALHQCHGNQSRAAKLLHMKSTTLNAKMKHYGINPVGSIMVQRSNGRPLA